MDNLKPRIENKEMDIEFHNHESMYLETNTQIPFIILKDTQLIVSLNPQNDTFMIDFNTYSSLKNTMLKAHQNYNNLNFYHNSILAKINQKDVNDILIKESYLSIAIFFCYILF